MERSHTTKAALEQELAQWQQRCAALEAELAAKDSAMREAQDTLERSAAYNKRVYQDSPVPIVIIDPATGVVEGVVDLTGLLPDEEVTPTTDVLNGIAYDAAGKRIFVTGKNWSKLFEIEIIGK